MTDSPAPFAALSTEEVLAAVAAVPMGAEVGRYVLSVFHTLRVQGRSRITEDEARAWAQRAGLDWEVLRAHRAGHVGLVLARGPRSTADLVLVEAWIARGIAGRLAATVADRRRKVLEDLIPIADHMRLLSQYDPYRMLGSFLDRGDVVVAFEALTDTIVRDARALGAGRSSRLRAVITQRLESLVRVLPPNLRAPMEERIRTAGGDPSVPLLLDAALGLTPSPSASTGRGRPPSLEQGRATGADGPTFGVLTGTVVEERGDGETLEGACEASGGRTLLALMSAMTGVSLVRGLFRSLGRLLLGLRRAAVLRTSPEGVTIVERTWLLGRRVAERSAAVGREGLAVLRVERRTPLFILLFGLLCATLGARAGLYRFLDGIRGEYAATVAFALLLVGLGVGADLVALWAAERMGARVSLTLRTADGRWLRVGGLDHARAMRFVAQARQLGCHDSEEATP